MKPGRHILQDGILLIEIGNRDGVEQPEIYTNSLEIPKNDHKIITAAKARAIAFDDLKKRRIFTGF
jgi:hypothetical protein